MSLKHFLRVGFTGCDRYIAEGVLAPDKAHIVRCGRNRVVTRFFDVPVLFGIGHFLFYTLNFVYLSLWLSYKVYFKTERKYKNEKACILEKG